MGVLLGSDENMRTQTALILLLALSACQQQPKPDDRICSTPPAIEPGAWSNCIHKWAYRMAGAPGPSSDVAKAAVAACADAVAYQVNEAKPEDRLQLLNDINRSAPGIALFRVVQARAGHCAIPE
jgi:hypothetical protein